MMPMSPLLPHNTEYKMSETDLITKIAAAVAGQLRPPIPLSIDLWDIEMIARFLKREAATVRDRMACLPGFPKAIRLPTTRGKAQPLYNAQEVIDWAQSYREKN